ncbi:DUF86 domain-containing protein [Candidatus Woesearchaeota archaeon]|nr:DUF86 domain-containing protein [Candidatus Woesearchaeota archaeon]
MVHRIEDKTKEIEQYLDELLTIVPDSLDIYKNDIKIKAACERYFEKIIESIVNLTFLIIKDKNLKIPEEDKEAFDILYKEGIIKKKLADRLKEAKGMRNILAHEYGKVDDEIVFNSITFELENDIKEFLKEIKT